MLTRENTRLRGDLLTLGRRFSHDLRTPLNCIGTACEALGDPAAATDSAEFVQSISDSVAEAAALVARISAVLMATAQPSPLQAVTMEEIVWGALQRLEPRIVKAGASVIRPDTWPAVSGVPGWLDLIWLNLVANSLQYAGAKPRIELGSSQEDGELRCWIRDSGQGVAPARRAGLFLPFDRLHELNAPRGYGLPIVHRLVELQGGRCGYEAEPAPGGTFFFTLPRSRPGADS